MLPKKVHPKNGAWYYVHKNKWTYLCRITEGEHALYAALAKVVNPAPDRLALIWPKYLAEADLAPDTRKKYAQFFNGVLAHYFGHMRPDDITSVDIAQYLEMRKKQGAAVASNRERAALSSSFEFAMRHGWAKHNPCRGVRRNKERASKIYVSTDSLSETYDRSSEALKHLLNGKYLSGMRLTDLMKLRRSQLTKDGIAFAESKTGKENLLEWRPGLSEVIRRAIEHGDAIAKKITKRLPNVRPLPVHVFVNNRGKPWTQWGVSSAMRRAKATFAIRHLRSKAQTDSAENVLGHDGQMRERYTKRRRLKPVA